jgi:hypothetical protein
MSATLKLTHKAIGVEVRRGTFDVQAVGCLGHRSRHDAVLRARNGPTRARARRWRASRV